MESGKRARRLSFVSLALLAMMLLVPAMGAVAQYPPPTPEPTGTPTFSADLECVIEATPDSLIIRCTGSGFLPGSEVLAQIYGVGCNVSAVVHVSDGIVAAPLTGEELLVQTVLTADEDGNVVLDIGVPCCDLDALRILLTGVNRAGDPLVLESIIDDPVLLECAAGQLSETGFDWLRWLAVGLVLVTAGAWIANVRDERTEFARA